MSLRTLAQRCRLFSTLLAAPAALLLSQGQAKAILNVNIFDDGPNLKVTVNGSISGSPGTAVGTSECGTTGILVGQFSTAGLTSLLCTGNDSSSDYYSVSGPAGYGGNGFLGPADSVAGLSFWLIPSSYGSPPYANTYQLDNAYVLGQPFFSSATFNGKSLASEGFTATGLVGTWTIDGTPESINVCIGTGPCGGATVPGPLPLFGAGAAFGWSRRLRKRIAAPLITPPQA